MDPLGDQDPGGLDQAPLVLLQGHPNESLEAATTCRTLSPMFTPPAVCGELNRAAGSDDPCLSAERENYLLSHVEAPTLLGARLLIRFRE